MELKHVELGSKGAIRAVDDDVQYGEITYSKAGDTNIIVDHTEVEPIAKGKGVGKKLVQEIVSIARERNWKVLPLCPFAKAEFEKNEGYKDVLM